MTRVTSQQSRVLLVLAWATLVANIGIIVTGGVVRLTGSGLGCPTWPRCTDDSFVPQGELGIHGAIEFGNRLLTFVVAAVAVATFVAAWRYGTRRMLVLATVIALGVPAQAVIGGITVLTDLNPWIVALHLLVSLAMVSAAVVLIRRVLDARTAGTTPDHASHPVHAVHAGHAVDVVHPGFRVLAWAILVVGWGVLYIGTIVTGSGPHAGDADAPRNGLDPRAWSQFHVDLVFLMLGLTIAAVVLLHLFGAPARVRRPAYALLGVELAQGVVGFVQYYLGLPIVLVALHLLGAALTAAAMTWLVVATRAPAGQAKSGSMATETNSSER